MIRHLCPPIAILGFLSCASGADLVVHPIFSDHAVLQRDKPVAIWGTADPSAPVTARFADQEVTANSANRWINSEKRLMNARPNA